MTFEPPPPPPTSTRRGRALAGTEQAPSGSIHDYIGPPSSRARRPPGGALKVFLQLLAGIAAITAGVTAILLVTGGERSAVKEYVTLVREKKNSEAYAMLASERKGEFSPDAFPQRLHTALLAKSTDIDIGWSSRSSPGKGCVTASVEGPSGKQTLHFYVMDEHGAKAIHSVLTSEELAASGATLEPWPCD